jgi:hypothetical protein
MGDCLGAERQPVLIDGLTNNTPRQNVLKGWLLPLWPFSAAPLHLGASQSVAHRDDERHGQGPGALQRQQRYLAYQVRDIRGNRRAGVRILNQACD